VESTEVLSFDTGDIGVLDRPVMLIGLEGWFDMAGAATQAINAFTNADHAVTVGSIDPDPFYDFTQQRPHVSVDDDIRSIIWPVHFQHDSNWSSCASAHFGHCHILRSILRSRTPR